MMPKSIPQAFIYLCLLMLAAAVIAFGYNGYISPYIPYPYLKLIWEASPAILVLVIAVLGNEKFRLVSAILSIVAIWWGISALSGLYGAAATVHVRHSYSYWQILSSYWYWFPALVSAGTTIIGVGGLIKSSKLLSKGWDFALRSAKGVARDRGLVRDSDSDLYGQAKWMDPKKAISLCEGRRGILLGQIEYKKKMRLVHYPLEAHGMTIAPTRSGKGVSAIIPNILAATANSWEGPVVVIEPKGESWSVCVRRRRELGRKTILLDPFGVIKGETSAKYNPLDFVRRSKEGVRDLAAMISPLLGASSSKSGGGDNSFFEKSARTVIMGFFAWAIVNPNPANRNMAYARRLLQLPWSDPDGVSLEAECEKMSASAEFYNLPADAASVLVKLRDSERTLASLVAECLNTLNWMIIPELSEQVSESTFNVEDICAGDTDLFVFVPPSALEEDSEAKLWLRMWASIPLIVAERTRPKSRLLVLLDEAAAIGKLNAVVSAYQLAAGYNISMWLFSQDWAGLKEAYGDNKVEIMRSNSDFLQVYKPSDTAPPSTFNDIAESLGNKTVMEVSNSENSGDSSKITDFVANHSRGTSTSEKQTKRHLMTPEDIRAMDRDELIVFHRHEKEKGSLRLRQVRYYKHPDFKGMFGQNPHHPGKAA
ncbi:type IV secretory system conjugative DNA transfer family protein [Bosea beijingensis]|uniref:type IV secretory system conjugative DNA transfer family protein n=1 Tax=Bosea beijingensis TaxID=3068632 RepID=UPI002741E0DF|nr:type IV secretory system conjugative DNA transfer family protein [Bosea sp. REN20]